MEQSAIIKNKNNRDFICKNDVLEQECNSELFDCLPRSIFGKFEVKQDTINPYNIAFDRQLPILGVKEKSLDEIIRRKHDVTEENVLMHLGSEFIFTKFSQDVKSIFKNRDPLQYIHKKSIIASLFDHEETQNLFDNFHKNRIS